MDSSSKVTVEYHDPSGIFALVSPDISSRLPLRNLNWRSQNRPLRQIKSLHLDFAPDAVTKQSLQPAVPQTTTERNTSFDIVGSGRNQRKESGKERRHQIPGLQTSPYLKIYVLRCDDKATYKATERAKIREWTRQSTAAKKKGNHDAFEWLILHVVVPDTLAASEPRWRETKPEDAEDLKERPKQGAKWPGKSSSTVFDKLRKDFNESGKAGQDRVAQIRLPREQFPYDLLPTPAVPGTLNETLEEREKAWIDLITKIRTLILDSFDTRVKQYEADITEQESRRSMPGFNFCTFFIYKEGLAKALESIGLIEDALVIYDELALGLEIVLRDIASGRAEGTATTFAPYTDDIQARLTGDKKALMNGVDTVNGEAKVLGDSETVENDYREQIVRSSISVFDFFIYLFSRQKTILLRLANARAARIQLGLSPRGGSEDMILISEVCWRGASFIHNNARILRQDLLTCREFEVKSNLSDADVESLVCLWMYEAAGKVLDDTSSFALDQLPSLSGRENLTNGHSISPNASSPGLRVVSAHPSRTSSLRTSSLPPRNSRVSALQDRSSLQSASENDLMNRPMTAGMDQHKYTESQPGFAELVTYRASLLMMQRKALELVAEQRGWSTGWASVMRGHGHTTLDYVDLNEDSPKLTNGSTENQMAYSRLLSPALAAALSSEHRFYETYEQFSERAMRYHITATQAKSAETVIGDLAILKYHQGDFTTAVAYFQHILPLYTDGGWNLMEIQARKVHAKCLKELGRDEEYIRTSLMLLAKTCVRGKDSAVQHGRPNGEGSLNGSSGMMAELVACSRELDKQVLTTAEQFFSNIQLDRAITHPESRDGFSLGLHLRCLLEDELALDRVRVRLIKIDDRSQEVLLESDRPACLQHGSNSLALSSNTIAFGAYLADKLILESGGLRFEHDFATAPLDESTKAPDDHKQPYLFLYPAQDTFSAEITLASDVQLEAPRHLEIRLSSGRNEIDNLDLRLKPGSSGLRLHLADAKVIDIDKRHDEETPSGQIPLSHLKAQGSALISVPYTLEQAGLEVIVRLELQYHTSQGSFAFVESFRLPTRLPLNVDVHDIFHFDALFSSFTVRTTSPSPLCVTHATLESSRKFAVSGPPAISIPMPVFDGEPVKLVYQITRKPVNKVTDGAGKDSLTLNVTYHVMDEALNKAILAKFTDAVSESPFASISRVLCSILAMNAKNFWSSADLQTALLLSESNIPSFNEIGWEGVVTALPQAIQLPLTTWLKAWHDQNPVIHFGPDTGSVGCIRSVSIPVDVPQADAMHRVSLTLVRDKTHIKHYPPIFALDEPVRAQIKISSASKWTDNTSNTTAPKHFVYEVHADPDTWLIGGQRRGHFTVQQDGEMSYELVLIPLRLGFITLPLIDVQPEVDQGHSEGSSVKAAALAYTSETHYESAGEVVQVIRNTKVSRVHIPETGLDMRPTSRTGVIIKENAVG